VNSFNRRAPICHHTDVSPDPGPSSPASAYPEAWIEGCRRGERSALARVLRAEAPYVERVLFRVAGNRAEVEDLLQSTLEQAIRAFPSFRAEASVRTWLTRIAVRTALHHLKHPAQRRRADLTLVEEGLAQPEGPSAGTHAEAEARSSLALLYEHLAELEPVQRLAFVLFQVEGRSMEEVAALMDANVSTTKSRVMWARRRLFERLERDPRGRELFRDRTGGAREA
jgi:RNA polymerase sigma-70 factor, ECF subfamily